jgi:hypothetical protein
LEGEYTIGTAIVKATDSGKIKSLPAGRISEYTGHFFTVAFLY